MFNRLEEVALRYRKLELELSKPEVTSNPSQLRELTRELAGLRETVQVYEKWRGLNVAIEENRALLRDPDPEIRELAKA